ncbi:MAG TPA: hypothetical protein VHZ31_02825 [Solirubrobacteraceae bacterium]|nr:hypothetical protein [Solirubrobacteraceae bacterium]
MDSFALSERWNGWTDLDAVVRAARAATAAGPLDPPICEIAIESDEDTTTIADLDELQALLAAGEDPVSLDIVVAHVVEADASVRLAFNGRWLQIYGEGRDWTRAKAAYDAAQAEIARVAGITTFKLPVLPRDTVAETRRRLDEPER